jgi:hypothetical protein
MKDKLELDPRIMQKNLEISKLKQDKDRLISELVEVKDQLQQAIDLLEAASKYQQDIIDETADL